MKTAISALTAAAMLTAAMPAKANNLNENGAWQFRSASDLASLSAALDVMARKQSGSYAAPVYNTNIARQFNCGVSASALGNSGGQTALANSPTVTGATSGAQGNASDTALGGLAGGTSSSGQDNSGTVTSGVTGGTEAAITGSSSLALNSTQTNGGAQSAGVTGSTACTFGALN